MTYTMERHTDNRLSMLSLGRMKTQVMMLLMLMMAGVITETLAQEPAGVQTVEAGVKNEE